MFTDALVRFSLRTDVCGKPARDNKCVALASAATDTQLTFVEIKISSNGDGLVIGKMKEEVQEKPLVRLLVAWRNSRTDICISPSPPFKKKGCASL